MAKTKTSYTGANVEEFIITTVEDEKKRNDSFQLIELFEKWSGCKAKMWGPTIIGFGNYHYKYASGHQGDAPMLGFSPRKAAFSLYVFSDTPKSQEALTQLGKYKMAKACIYIKKLDDIQLEALKTLCDESLTFLKERYECQFE